MAHNSANNLMIESIERIYTDGNLDIISNGQIVSLKIQDKKLATTNMSSSNSNENEQAEDEILSVLASLAYYTFYRDQGITLESSPDDIDEKDKLAVANRLFKIYSSMLNDNPDFIKQLLFHSSPASPSIIDISESETSERIYDIENIKALMNVSTTRFSSVISKGNELLMKLYNSQTDKEYYANYTRLLDFLGVDITQSEIHNALDTTKTIDTSFLDKVGVAYEIINDRDYVVNPSVGRENVIRDVGATLLTPSSSPILIGNPGVGKTAVVEGLTYTIVNNQAPSRLINKTILKITPSSIVSGCTLVGMFEQRMEEIIKFLKKNPDIILYIDELHTAFNTGTGGHNKNDILNILKPHIENGSIKMIGATTKEEYDEYLQKDSAFTRRFKRITVDEPDDKTLEEIIIHSIERYEALTNVIFETDINKLGAMIDLLINLTSECNRDYQEKRYNPALVLSIIENAFGYASYDNQAVVGATYLAEAVNRCESIYKGVRERVANELRSLKKSHNKSMVIDFQNYQNNLKG